MEEGNCGERLRTTSLTSLISFALLYSEIMQRWKFVCISTVYLCELFIFILVNISNFNIFVQCLIYMDFYYDIFTLIGKRAWRNKKPSNKSLILSSLNSKKCTVKSFEMERQFTFIDVLIFVSFTSLSHLLQFAIF